MNRFKVMSVVALALLSGCGAPVFPKELFTIDGSSADYPVMVSRAPSSNAGRPVEAHSGTHEAQSTSSYRVGNTQVNVTHVEASSSELAASVKLAAQVHRNDKWLQVERAVFDARDFATYGAASADRDLALQGTVHK